jgi:hypothetical protein
MNRRHDRADLGTSIDLWTSGSDGTFTVGGLGVIKNFESSKY